MYIMYDSVYMKVQNWQNFSKVRKKTTVLVSGVSGYRMDGKMKEVWGPGPWGLHLESFGGLRICALVEIQ